MRRSIQGMLEELEPNLWEHTLSRLVDYGHTFSPEIEMAALAAGKELLHGEAVNIDMALTTQVGIPFLANFHIFQGFHLWDGGVPIAGGTPIPKTSLLHCSASSGKGVFVQHAVALDGKHVRFPDEPFPLMGC